MSVRALIYGQDFVTVDGLQVSFWDLVPLMRDDIRERLQNYLRLATAQQFVDAYAHVHQKVTGAKWVDFGRVLTVDALSTLAGTKRRGC